MTNLLSYDGCDPTYRPLIFCPRKELIQQKIMGLSRFFSFLEFSVIYWIRNNFPILCYLLLISIWFLIQLAGQKFQHLFPAPPPLSFGLGGGCWLGTHSFGISSTRIRIPNDVYLTVRNPYFLSKEK